MKGLIARFIAEEDGDVVQNVIIIAILAALALLFGETIVGFVNNLISNISGTGTDAVDVAEGIRGGGGGE